MKPCPACSHENPDEANFCSQCGQTLVIIDSPSVHSKVEVSQEQLWETFIGPSKSIQFSLKDGWSWRRAFVYYREKFQRIDSPQGPRFVLSWNWPAALFDSFLWFLYRKMYLFALLYAVAPALAIFLTGDMSVGLVSRVLAGGSANYLYYWHVKDKLQRIFANPHLDDGGRIKLVEEEGGVQPYVIWLGVALHLFMIGLVIAAIQGGEPAISLPREGGEKYGRKFF